ncbi:hypothetical protein AB205_0075300 [Aquarana catesbeiana]|uniref:DDE Tnp4 domain-containing protein n=1 Tax=Aquarana catesbeiana TaxID=8400 RepID=A0A2G9RL24_AQUCT|nr:hypothetical protein AB205_0075300 [Aquarana catesbeiana]
MLRNPRRERAVYGLRVLAVTLARSRNSRSSGMRSIWAKTWLLIRDQFSHMPLLRELQENNPNDYRNYLRMMDSCFQQLLSLLSPYIIKQDTCMRAAIPAEQRLIATLHYLATGRSLQDIKFTTGISPQALGVIIPETCSAIIQVLQKDYIRFPSNTQQWKDVAAQFDNLWNFPNCGGGIDGKHVRIVPPPNSGSYYFDYKGFCSIVLLAVLSANYEFLYVNVGMNGRHSDGGVMIRTEFYDRLQKGTLHLPNAQDNIEGLNFVFVADEAFSLGEHILKLFPMRNLSPQQRIFNYRLSRARRVVENAFGILSSRFRLFLTAINLAEYRINHVVLCCCILHNFLRRNAFSYIAPGQSDEPFSQPAEKAVMPALESACAGLGSQNARLVCEQYMDYFVSRGAVPWQQNLLAE